MQSKERMRSRYMGERNNKRTEELCERECKRETTIEAQSEQSATTRWAMSSGRRSDDNILALASTSLGRRQTTPASLCSSDNSSSPSGSLPSKKKINLKQQQATQQTHLNNVPPPPNPGEAVVVHSGAATPLITAPLFKTSCCSSAHCIFATQSSVSQTPIRFTKLRTECKWVAPHWSHVPFDRLYPLCPF
jgi:hypothetical protein